MFNFGELIITVGEFQKEILKNKVYQMLQENIVSLQLCLQMTAISKGTYSNFER